MRIVVTGGTGFIGRAVVDALIEDGAEHITVTTRNPEGGNPWIGRDQVTLAQAFAGDPTSLGRAFAHADCVIHAIQFQNHPVEDASRGRTYLEVDGKGTATAARVAKNMGVKRFVYLSGAGAGQGRKEPWFVAKEMAEQSIAETGMEYVHLRPSWIYGKADRSMNRFVAFCRYLPFVPVIGDGTTPVFPVSVKDVARCAVAALKREDAKGRAFDLGGPERLTMDQIIQTIQGVLGTRKPLLHHPSRMMKLLVRPMALLKEPILSPTAIDFILQEVEIDPKTAPEFFGFPFRRLAQGLSEYLKPA